MPSTVQLENTGFGDLEEPTIMATEEIIDEESLFSLELVVDQISLPKIVCRFPAVAFRLLDFPTLLIYHVEPDLAETIREKISKDPHYKVPHQLHELQDKYGSFPVKKGKSCLFKVPLRILHTHLSNCPLYVMIIDTYPEVSECSLFLYTDSRILMTRQSCFTFLIIRVVFYGWLEQRTKIHVKECNSSIPIYVNMFFYILILGSKVAW